MISNLVALVSAIALCGVAHGQGSQQSLRFYGTGTGQLDRARIPVDDDAPGPDASAPSDVGAGDFSVDFWVRAEPADNPTTSAGGDVELGGGAWLNGNVVVDRSIFGGSDRAYGVSLAGGVVRFFSGAGDGPGADAPHTLEGSDVVIDGSWHHVAVTRDAASGLKRIYVDGALDFETAAGVSFADLSYPDAGVPGAGSPWGPYLVVGAAKHDVVGPPSFAGFVDELRVWDRALSETEVLSFFDRALPTDPPGLVANYRFEEGAGTVLLDSSDAGSPDGELIAGVPGNGEWRAYFGGAANTAPISHGLLPPGFHREKLLGGLSEPTSIEFLPDGRLLIAERQGAILVYKNGALLPTPLIQLSPVIASIEHGIMGMAPDPAFAANGFLYVHYTSSAQHDRVSRFTIVGDTADPVTEFVLWENPVINAGHTGGGVVFGFDGKLYVPLGDAFFPPNSQDVTTPNGSVLRLNPDGSIPADNPVIPGSPPGTWAWGLRNPFRTNVDPLTGDIWIADVGGDWPAAYEEIHLAVPGANYGWPDMEGPDCVVTDCTGMTPSVFAVQHDDPAYVPSFPAGSITGGPVYRGAMFPRELYGNMFVADYANRWIRRLVFDGSGLPVADPVFIPNLFAGTIVDMAVAADGSLYYVTVGMPWIFGPDDPSVFRVTYTAPDDPVPRSTVVLDTDPSGLTVFLDTVEVTTPFVFETPVGTRHEVTAPSTADAGGPTLDFTCWSDGGAETHSITAPAGGLNVTAGYGAPGATCDDLCGFEGYGHGTAPANVLGLVGAGAPTLGQVVQIKTTNVDASATFAWLGVSLDSWSNPIYGGMVLVDSFQQFLTAVLPAADGVAFWSAPVPANPALAGFEVYMQTLATDPGQSFGLAFSNGLKATFCP